MMDGPKKAPPPPGPRERNRPGGPASARPRVAKRATLIGMRFAPERPEVGICLICITAEPVNSRTHARIPNRGGLSGNPVFAAFRICRE